MFIYFIWMGKNVLNYLIIFIINFSETHWEEAHVTFQPWSLTPYDYAPVAEVRMTVYAQVSNYV